MSDELQQELLRVIARQNEILARLEAKLEQPRTANILPLSEAWKVLGYPNKKACAERIGPLYRVGVEAIDRRRRDAVKASWYLDIEACKKRDREQPARRSA